MNKISQLISALRTKQTAKSQEKLLERFLFDKKYARKMSRHHLHACIGEWLPEGGNGRILELGCGPGKYVAMLSTLGFDIYGVDPLYFPTWEIIRKESSATLQEEIFAENLPFEDNTFDHVVCLGTLLYLNDPLKGLQEIIRVIRPGGHIIIRTVNKHNLYTLKTGRKLDPASKYLYTMDELVSLVAGTGIIVKKTFSYGFWPPFWTDFWWYLVSVWLPVFVQEFLSNKMKPENRVNNIVFAIGPLK